jgi:hypothetical protein
VIRTGDVIAEEDRGLMRRPELVTQGLLLILIAAVCWMAYRLGDVARRTPVDPAPPAVQPGPAPKPEVKPDLVPPPAAKAPETPLSRALRDYHQRFPAVVPRTLWELADKLDSGEITDKDTAIKFYKRDAVPLSQALDGIFTPGVDSGTKEGKVTSKAAISGPLRQTARALGYKPPAQADAGSRSFAPEAP